MNDKDGSAAPGEGTPPSPDQLRRYELAKEMFDLTDYFDADRDRKMAIERRLGQEKMERERAQRLARSPSSGQPYDLASSMASIRAHQERQHIVGKPLPIYQVGDPRPRRKFSISGLLPDGGGFAGSLSGIFGVGKSHVMAHTAVNQALGLDVAGCPILRRGGAFIFALEAEVDLPDMIRAAAQGCALPEHWFRSGEQRYPVLWTDRCPTILLPRGRINPQSVADMKATIDGAREQLQRDFELPMTSVWIDHIGRCAGWDSENDNTQVTKVVDALTDVSRAAEAPVIFLGHPPLSDPTRPRGGGAREDNADFSWVLLGERQADGPVTNRRLWLRKMRGGRDGMRVSFELSEVTLPDVGAHGEPVTEVAVRWVADPVAGQAAGAAQYGKAATAAEHADAYLVEAIQQVTISTPGQGSFAPVDKVKEKLLELVMRHGLKRDTVRKAVPGALKRAEQAGRVLITKSAAWNGAVVMVPEAAKPEDVI